MSVRKYWQKDFRAQYRVVAVTVYRGQKDSEKGPEKDRVSEGDTQEVNTGDPEYMVRHG